MADNLTEGMQEFNHEWDARTGITWDAGRFQWSLGDRALIMGILNVTPDSFSDGGRSLSSADALQNAQRMIAEGADLLDVGGESTRPGADPVSLHTELSRTIPVIEALVGQPCFQGAAISIDTNKPEVAKAALKAGAHIVNDITGLRDPEMIEVCKNSECGIVVMHMKGTPKTMQQCPSYQDVIDEVGDFFRERLSTLEREGIDPNRIVFDPGIGFGKSLDHNLALIEGLPRLADCGRPLLMGLSRKSLIAGLVKDPSMGRRTVPTQALSAVARSRGALIHRVHQVKECREAIRMVEAIENSTCG